MNGTSLDSVGSTGRRGRDGFTAQQVSGRDRMSRESDDFEELLQAQFQKNQMETQLAPTLEDSAE